MSLIKNSLSLTSKFASNKALIRCLSSYMTKLNQAQNLSIKSPKLLVLNKPVYLNSILNYTTEQDVKKRIDQMVKSKPVVVFMKGNANQPMCGFSKAVVDILNMHGVKFEAHNVLADENLRSGIKEYSNWPTIPQVFFNGEFVGGCDILLEMHRSGELIDELKKIGIDSKLAEE